MFSQEIVEYFSKFSKVALAVSGGRDSMALLYEFICHKNELCPFAVVNIHHNLRGEEGKNDSLFVENFCNNNGVEFIFFDEDIKEYCNDNHYTIEQGARLRRREIFDMLIDGNAVERVVTAHHADDQTESILMHIFRGSGINGLKGMTLDDGKLVRPLLSCTRDNINTYIQDNKIPYVEDSTNQCNDYARNKLRNEIIPAITQLYGGAKSNINKLSDIAKDAMDIIDQSCPTLKQKNGIVEIKLDKLQTNNLIFAESVAKAVDIVGSRVDLTSKHLSSIKNLMTAQTGKTISLPRGIIVEKTYKSLSFYDSKNQNLLADNNQQSYVEYGIVSLGQWIVDINAVDNGGLRCDYDKIVGKTMRFRKNGDKIKKFGGGTKSLGDFFTDKKVAKNIRDNLIVIAQENNILAVVTIDISKDIAIDENTKNVAYINAYYKEKI